MLKVDNSEWNLEVQSLRSNLQGDSVVLDWGVVQEVVFATSAWLSSNQGLRLMRGEGSTVLQVCSRDQEAGGQAWKSRRLH